MNSIGTAATLVGSLGTKDAALCALSCAIEGMMLLMLDTARSSATVEPKM
jgi:hypothetical protein